MKTAKILTVNFPKDSAIFCDIMTDFAAGLTRDEARHIGWDIRRDMIKGTRIDTGWDITYSTGQYTLDVELQTPITRLYTVESGSCDKQDYSLLPPVASL